MVMLVSLQQASDHLRRDTSDDDADLTLKIKAASRAVIHYIKDGATFLDTAGEVALDTNGDPEGVPEEVQAATLLLVGFLYKDRDQNSENAFERGYLPKPVTALLYPLRTPSIG